MSKYFRQFFTNYLTRPGADRAAVLQAGAALGFEPPGDYIAALTYTDGGEGFVGQQYLRLYSVAELVELNAAYRVSAFAPGLFVIGSNGSSEAYGFDTRTVPAPVVQVPFIPLDFQYADVRGDTFLGFLSNLAGTDPLTGSPAPLINMEAVGKEAHFRQPLVFNGSPTDPGNQVLVPSEAHAEICVFWNGVYMEKEYGRKVP